jgi:hypothetical protein
LRHHKVTLNSRMLAPLACALRFVTFWGEPGDGKVWGHKGRTQTPTIATLCLQVFIRGRCQALLHLSTAATRAETCCELWMRGLQGTGLGCTTGEVRGEWSTTWPCVRAGGNRQQS